MIDDFVETCHVWGMPDKALEFLAVARNTLYYTPTNWQYKYRAPHAPRGRGLPPSLQGDGRWSGRRDGGGGDGFGSPQGPVPGGHLPGPQHPSSMWGVWAMDTGGGVGTGLHEGLHPPSGRWPTAAPEDPPPPMPLPNPRRFRRVLCSCACSPSSTHEGCCVLRVRGDAWGCGRGSEGEHGPRRGGGGGAGGGPRSVQRRARSGLAPRPP